MFGFSDAKFVDDLHESCFLWRYGGQIEFGGITRQGSSEGVYFKHFQRSLPVKDHENKRGPSLRGRKRGAGRPRNTHLIDIIWSLLCACFMQAAYSGE